MHVHRTREMEGIARKYRAIGPLLTKMEGLVAHTNTGRSPKMHPYYIYWESKIYDALLKVSTFISLMIQFRIEFIEAEC